MSDPLLACLWANRSADGLRREKQLLVDFLCSSAGGPRGDMPTSHKGMGITARDWDVFMGHVRATLDKFGVPVRERGEVLGFIDSLKANIVEP
jgi:hemoglobin